MDQLWLSAPALALKVWRDRGTIVWRANDALTRWTSRREISTEQWQRLAEAVEAHGAITPEPEGESVASPIQLWFAGERMQCSVVHVADGCVSWLLHEPARGASEAHHGEGQHWPAGTLDLAQEFGRMGVFVRNVRDRSGQWSPHTFRLFGWEADDRTPPTAKAVEAMHPDDRERAAAEIRAMHRTLGRHENRFRIVRADGSVHHIHGLSEVRPGSDGAPELMIGVLIDDTEVIKRMQLHEQLSARLTQAADLAFVSVWRIDLATQRIDFNNYGYESVGLAREPGGVPLERIRDTIHPEDAEAVRLAAEEAIATGQVVDVEARYRNRDGSYRHLLTRRVAERDASGRIVALVGVSIDQTQQALERQHAQTLADRIDIVTQAAGVGVWTIDIATEAVEWNDQMFLIYGLAPGSRAPTLAEMVERFVHPDDRAKVWQQRAHAERYGSTHFEFRIFRPDGELRWVSTWSRRVKTVAGLRMAYGVTMDVTERQRVEQALRDKESAERASRAKSEFLSRMSHELRTPLNAVLGFVQLLMHDGEDRLNPRQVERLRHAHSAGSHLMALINDVLDLASIESGTLQLEAQPIALQEAIDEVMQWTRAQAERAGIAVHVGRTAGWVRADGRRLRQVLSNLVSNAIKYNRAHGEVWIDAEAAQRDGAEGWQVHVRDSGRGLNAQQRAHLFEPFNRLGAEREGIEGTGIGLAIVRHMVELMGGSIEVSSTPGLGSTFSLFLPAAQAPASAASQACVPPQQAAPACELRVLYIEDNPVNVLLVEEIFAMRPAMQLSTAANGTSGVELAVQSVPDVVLIDMQLPDFDGFEVLRRLRAQPQLGGAAFIALSAGAMPEDIEQARVAGFFDYWTKPIDLARFLAGLDALARERQ